MPGTPTSKCAMRVGFQRPQGHDDGNHHLGPERDCHPRHHRHDLCRLCRPHRTRAGEGRRRGGRPGQPRLAAGSRRDRPEAHEPSRTGGGRRRCGLRRVATRLHGRSDGAGSQRVGGARPPSSGARPCRCGGSHGSASRPRHVPWCDPLCRHLGRSHRPVRAWHGCAVRTRPSVSACWRCRGPPPQSRHEHAGFARGALGLGVVDGGDVRRALVCAR